MDSCETFRGSAVAKTKGGHFEVRSSRGDECAESYDRADRRSSVTFAFEHKSDDRDDMHDRQGEDAAEDEQNGLGAQ